LLEEHVDFIHRVVTNLAGPHLDPEDLAQDVLITAFKRWDTFEARSSLQTWLYGVALGVVRNARRRNHIRRLFGLSPVVEPAVPPSTPAELYERQEARESVHALLEQLPEKKRTVLILFEFEGLSGEQIAEIIDCPLQTVWNRLFQARKELARHLVAAERLEREREREGERERESSKRWS
jgi:RNA polymerase sigma-70 factor (ECF subfamily)